MNTYEIPRNYKGEGRILYIFSTKALIYTFIGLAVGLIFYFIFTFLFLLFKPGTIVLDTLWTGTGNPPALATWILGLQGSHHSCL